MYRLIDTHAHLEGIEGFDRTVAEARSCGVVAVIGVGSDYESNQKVLDLARLYTGFVYPALGLHPYSLGELGESGINRTLEFIEANIAKAVAIGEVGLDYHKRIRAFAEKDLQRSVLRQTLEIARRYKKPVSIHSRYAWQDGLSLVEAAQVDKVVFHWYAGTSSVLRGIVNGGYYISATPAVEYHKEHRRAVKEVPLDRLLLETDSPVVYQQGSELEYRSTPASLIRTLRDAAELRGISEAELAEITTNNALRFFGLTV